MSYELTSLGQQEVQLRVDGEVLDTVTVNGDTTLDISTNASVSSELTDGYSGSFYHNWGTNTTLLNLSNPIPMNISGWCKALDPNTYNPNSNVGVKVNGNFIGWVLHDNGAVHIDYPGEQDSDSFDVTRDVKTLSIVQDTEVFDHDAEVSVEWSVDESSAVSLSPTVSQSSSN